MTWLCGICRDKGEVSLPIYPSGYDGRVPIEHVQHQRVRLPCPSCCIPGRRDVEEWRQKMRMQEAQLKMYPPYVVGIDPAKGDDEYFIRPARGQGKSRAADAEALLREYHKDNDPQRRAFIERELKRILEGR